MPATQRKQQGSSRLDTLNERARIKPVDNFASIRTYYRSADLLLRQADLYRHAKNDDELYVMLVKFASLVVEVLPRHHAFAKSDPKYQHLWRSLATTYLPEAEHLKANVRLRDALEVLESQGPFQPKKSAGTVLLSAGNLPEIHWEEAGTPPPPPPAAGAALGVPQPEGFDLLSGPGAGPPATSGTSAATPLMASAALPVLPELTTSIRLPAASQTTLAKHALLPASFGSAAPRLEPPRPLGAPAQQRPLYPVLAEVLGAQQQAQQEAQPPPGSVEAVLAGLAVSGQQQTDGLQPPLPSPYGELQLGPQEVGVSLAPRPDQPLAPGAVCCQPGTVPPQQAVPAPQPLSGGVAEVKRLQQLRDVHVSVALMDEFMRYAASNTRRGIESCGILAGSLSADDAVFTITTLIVPKQTGTSDTVEMLNEEEIFEVQDSRALYPLGWIHTHPTQTCFLSSVDVHTHCGFQTMLDEAVAVVMAPRDPSKRVGIFRLTTPGGLRLVQRCPQRGFHAHPPTDTGQALYELCGHVYLNPRAKYEVVDLR